MGQKKNQYRSILLGVDEEARYAEAVSEISEHYAFEPHRNSTNCVIVLDLEASEIFHRYIYMQTC